MGEKSLCGLYCSKSSEVRLDRDMGFEMGIETSGMAVTKGSGCAIDGVSGNYRIRAQISHCACNWTSYEQCEV